MSRSGYSDDMDSQDLALYRGRVASAVRGRRGQRLLLDMLAGLDAMPAKRLITQDLERDGEVCALGVVGKVRGVDLHALDPEQPAFVARAFDVAEPLAREVAYVNDEHWRPETPEERWQRVRAWVVANLSTSHPQGTKP